MKKILTSLLLSISVIFVSNASTEIDGLKEAQDIATLENDILILKSELSKCQKSKKGWIAATVIGSAGVVATGIAAGVQGAQIKEQKNTISNTEQEIKNSKQTTGLTNE
ncbi:MAG: hypothetical protein IKZ34_00860 [Alphaproteobacteria bacterium]|nr:hypothetical protein [Alphaproteobacteria bacterium]